MVQTVAGTAILGMPPNTDFPAPAASPSEPRRFMKGVKGKRKCGPDWLLSLRLQLRWIRPEAWSQACGFGRGFGWPQAVALWVNILYGPANDFCFHRSLATLADITNLIPSGEALERLQISSIEKRTVFGGPTRRINPHAPLWHYLGPSGPSFVISRTATPSEVRII